MGFGVNNILFSPPLLTRRRLVGPAMKAELVALFALFAILCASTALLRRDGDDPRVASFFKLAHSLTGAPDYIKFVVPRLRPEYKELCSAVPDCDRRLMGMLDAQHAQVRAQMEALERLYAVLRRLARPPGGLRSA